MSSAGRGFRGSHDGFALLHVRKDLKAHVYCIRINEQNLRVAPGVGFKV